MICVYPADCTDFSTNGNGTLAPLSAEVTETLNGEYELTLVHPIDEAGKWRRLVEGCILRAPVPAAMTPRISLVSDTPGASTMIFAAYVLIGIWSYNQNCATTFGPKCYEVRDSMDVALVAASLMGACFGFLWWNASPAQIFMGDTGSLGLGGAIAGLAIVTRTEFLSVVLAGLFVIEALSVLIQVGVFKSTRKRFFRMAPLHHHFEMLGWEQITVVIRFWIIAGLFVAFGLGLFYAEWVVGAT